jgi:origin recognition complex subunit 3
MKMKTQKLKNFSSWRDRIRLVVLLGIATSVELFQERLPRTVTRCIDGVQFDVEQTSKTLERVFQKVVAGSNIPLLLGPIFVAALLERQHDHVQSLQSFISALKVRRDF